MATRWGLGPVFEFERRIKARRWQLYAGRSFFVFSLLAGMATIWWSFLDDKWSEGIQNQAKLGQAYFYAMVGIQLALTMIVAPAATAGAVCVERSRGSLAHMLVTDLRAPEIILGKLWARLLPTFALIACAWPVAAIGSLLGGIDPGYLTMAFAITLAVGLLGCSMALALSAWAKSVHEVLLAVYMFWGIILLGYPIAYSLSFTFGGWFVRSWMLTADPFWLAFAPYLDPGKNGPWDYGWFFGVAIGLSALCVVLAIIGVRVNPLGEARPKRQSRLGVKFQRMVRLPRWLPGPSLDGNPVLYREWYRGRSSRPMRLLTAALGLVSTAICAHGAYEIFTQGINFRAGFAGLMTVIMQVLFGLIMLGVFASLTFSDERRRASLDVLLATPLSTRSIVWGKWLGAFRVVPLLTIGPALIALALAHDDLSQFLARIPAATHYRYQNLNEWGRAFGAVLMPITILAHGAWICSLGLAMSIWVRRESRAISLVVTISILMAIGLPIIIIFLSVPGGNNPVLGSLSWIMASSPVMAVVQMIEVHTTRDMKSWEILGTIAIWDLFFMVAALLLFEKSVRTFDRSFDRVPEKPTTYRHRRQRKPPFFQVVGTPHSDLSVPSKIN